ncbi:MAG: GGDEF domain-containing phosphodiesterase [Lachnospiraceae bacterium]|nr:GGDEF domain-containing phosphodiesterase [Lachnospiraceae bacterium]
MDVKHIQMSVLLFGSILCFFIFIFGSILQYQSRGRKIALLHIELSTSILLLADYFAYLFRGDMSTLGYWMVRIANFLVFFFVYVELNGLNQYLRTFTYQSAKGGKVKYRCIMIMTILGMLCIVLSQFTGIFYRIDENNLYQRGPLFYISFVAPLVIYGLILSVVIEYRRIFTKMIFYALILFSTMPVVCSILQAFFYGLSLLNLSMGVCAIILFVFSLVDQNLLLVHISELDKLTELPNEHGFMHEIMLRFPKYTWHEYDAIYFDVVHMATYNRKYGNAVGDEILKEYARALCKKVEDDEVLGCIGGNRFIAFIRRNHTKDFLELLDGIDIRVINKDNSEKMQLTMKSVAGVYEVPNSNIEPRQILNYIITTCNVAKNEKHKPFLYLTPDLWEEIVRKRDLEAEIPLAMEKREFKPFYQPKVDSEQNKLCGAEALVRWDRNGEIIPPYRFVPVLEQADGICKFDFYMLDYVCQDLRKWIDQGLNPPTISVNFSRKNLGNPNLAKEIYDVILKYAVPPELIQIEITETVDEYPMEALKDVIEMLRQYGVSTAIDDFGTGSASINLLMEVPFSVLKIDKSFVDNLNDKKEKILEHIIVMSREMGADVIAEGVEERTQLDTLKKLNCVKIQGYFFDKPLAKSEFERRIRDPFYR